MITRRCSQRQFLLRPDKKTTAVFVYCLAEAARRHDIHLIAWCAMSNHYHAVVHDPGGRLPAFLELLHGLLARCLNVRWSRWENLWSSEPTCITLLPTADAVFDKVSYVLANPVVDHLIDRLVDWPGSSSIHHLDGRRTRHERPAMFFDPKGAMPGSVELAASPPPPSCRAPGESAAAWADRVRDAVARAERVARDQRLREGRRVLGRKAVLAVSAFDMPATSEPRRTLRPAVACRDRAVRIDALRQLVAFRIAYREARLRFASGDHRVVFPAGTYQLRFSAAVRCEPFPRSIAT
ncbi:MAG: hypothetical protein U0270_34995 [Labilithrix sp.]